MQWGKEVEACISYFKELAFTITINKLISAGETEELYITLVAAKSNEKALWVSDITQVSISLSCFLSLFVIIYLVGIYLFKIDNGNTRAMYEICSKLKTKTPELRP